jgi:hypothetical protein
MFMGAGSDRERFIPFRKRDIVEMLLEDGRLPNEEAKQEFVQFCELLQSVFHFEFRRKLETLKNDYFPFTPDRRCMQTYSVEELDRSAGELFETMRSVLNSANYEEISVTDLTSWTSGHSAIRVKVHVDMEDFDLVQMFYRGRYTADGETPRLLGFGKQPIRYEALYKVILMVRFKSHEHFKSQGRNHLPFQPGSTIIKLFRDVPRSDLKMLLPNSRAAMGTKDKLLLGVPAVAGGVPLLVTKVLPAAIAAFAILSIYFGVESKVHDNDLKELVAVLAGTLAMGGFCVQQWMKYKNKIYQFQKDLSDNLYFRNLVNNEGVFHSIVDSAEEEDCKESFLAYYFLLVTGKPLTKPDLDEAVEEWFEKHHGCKLDFEVDDAVYKLKRLNLLDGDPEGVLSVPPLHEALRRMDFIWDNYFQYNEPGANRSCLGRGC